MQRSNAFSIIHRHHQHSRLCVGPTQTGALEFDLGQEGENLDSFNSTIFAFALALILMYGLLVFQFNSFLQPLLIFLAIPFAFPLLFPGLYITNNPISFFVMIGIIALSGIVVNNSIFLVDYANQNRKDGKSIETSISKAVEVRFRPVLATSITTIAALLPLTLTNPFWEALGLTIIFGLAASSLMVLFILPLYYAIIEGIRDTKSKFLKKIV
ncbi:efflux RND transporter permease subunit [Patescibacteria group bacterium]|nr:efflux RND transporter permease subunit [Patescibacteria group bacterium]